MITFYLFIFIIIKFKNHNIGDFHYVSFVWVIKSKTKSNQSSWLKKVQATFAFVRLHGVD